MLALALLDKFLDVAEKINPPEKVPLAEVNLQPILSQADVDLVRKYGDTTQEELGMLRSKVQQLKMMLGHAKTIIDTAVEC